MDTEKRGKRGEGPQRRTHEKGEKRTSRRRRKRSSPFKYFVMVYAGMWIVLTVVLCSILWSGLSGYQHDYDTAQAAAKPELAMDQAMHLFSRENIRELIDQEQPEILSRFESLEDYRQFYYDFLEGRTLSYQRNEEEYHAARPVYDVYADGILFAKVSLKPKGEKDSFGFSKWTVRDIAISENNYEYHDIYLRVMEDMDVYLNGILMEETEYVRGGVIENELTDKVYELTGVSFGYKIYYAGNMVCEPTLTVIDGNGKDVSDAYVMAENELRDYVCMADGDFVGGVREDVKNFCETYVYHIYRKASVDTVAGMMEDGSEAERLLYNAQSTLAWAWVPETVEILSEDYDDFIYYNEEYFSCKSTIKIRKSGDGTVEEELFACRWLFKKVDGRWQVTYFVLG